MNNLCAGEAGVVGGIRLGETRSELDHRLEGHRSRVGETAGRFWRDAVDGGWFAFDLPVAPDLPCGLRVTYCGSGGTERVFDVFVEDRLVGTQHLSSEPSGRFFDSVYPIPVEETRGKTSVRVRFQVFSGTAAAGVAECRTILLGTAEAFSGNPLFQGADPDLLVEENRVWVYPTHRNGVERRFFAYSSPDLVRWQLQGPILDFADIAWIPDGKEAWAPGAARRNGKVYLYYSVGPKPSHIGVAVADSPAGPFRDSGRPLLSDDGDPSFEAIDAHVFTDPATGAAYLYAGGSAGARLRVWELGEDMMSLAREIEVETPPDYTEGPFMHYRDGRYYLSYSHGIWWDGSYTVRYATSDTPHGPWTYRGIILRSDARHRGPGHHAVLHNPLNDEWFVLYHRWNSQPGPGPYNAYRQVAIDRLEHDHHGLIRPVRMTDAGVPATNIGRPSLAL